MLTIVCSQVKISYSKTFTVQSYSLTVLQCSQVKISHCYSMHSFLCPVDLADARCNATDHTFVSFPSSAFAFQKLPVCEFFFLSLFLCVFVYLCLCVLWVCFSANAMAMATHFNFSVQFAFSFGKLPVCVFASQFRVKRL